MDGDPDGRGGGDDGRGRDGGPGELTPVVEKNTRGNDERHLGC